jgi:hypothetical protein
MNFDAWRFDIQTAIMTAIAIPVFTYLGKLIAKYVQDWLQFPVEGVLYHITARVKHPVAARLSFKHYARLQLANTGRYLPVPSSQDVKLDVDTTFVPLTLETASGDTSQDYLMTTLTTGRTRVIGDPGCGKSSLLKKLFRDACRAAIDKPALSRLPILIELRHLQPPQDTTKEKLGEWLYTVLRETVARNQIYSATSLFDVYGGVNGNSRLAGWVRRSVDLTI